MYQLDFWEQIALGIVLCGAYFGYFILMEYLRK